MQGILIVDKPAGFTSFDVVAKLRGICQTRRIGHSGTLDPMATGVLPVFIGQAAKAVDLQPRHDKVYQAVMRLGLRTDTGDITGAVLEQAPLPAGLDEAAVAAALPAFLGEGLQTPPMYSAVKVNGRPLYKAARAGLQVQRAPRPVVIHGLELAGRLNGTDYALHVHCGKGTYVRVLIEDIGRALGVPATMAALRRTAAGIFTEEDAHSLDEIQAARNAGRLEELLLGVETVFTGLPAVTVDEAGAARLLNGAPVYNAGCACANRRVRIRAAAGGFLGVGRLEQGALRAEKLFVERPAT